MDNPFVKTKMLSFGSVDVKINQVKMIDLKRREDDPENFCFVRTCSNLSDVNYELLSPDGYKYLLEQIKLLSPDTFIVNEEDENSEEKK
jgi:hypothetical protein